MKDDKNETNHNYKKCDQLDKDQMVMCDRCDYAVIMNGKQLCFPKFLFVRYF